MGGGSSLNKCKEKISNIEDPFLKDLVYSDFNNYLATLKNSALVSYYKYNKLASFIDSIINLTVADLTWDKLCDLVQHNKDSVREYSDLLLSLLEKDAYQGNHKDKLTSLTPYIKSAIKKHQLIDIFCYNEVEKFFYFYKEKTISRSLFYIQCDSPEIRNLLQEFIISNHSIVVNSYDSISNFDNSLKNTTIMPQKISDFSYDTFKEQLNYFATDYTHKFLHGIIAFYRFLIEHPSGEGAKIVDKNNGLSLNILRRSKLAQELLEGYRVVIFNPYDNIPIFDKWILEVGDFEKDSTKLSKDSCLIVNFSEIKEDLYRNISKEYFWNNSKDNLVTKANFAYLIKDPLNYITKLKDRYNKSNTPPVSYTRITINEAHLYKSRVKSFPKLSVWTKNSYLTAFRSLLSYASEKEYIELDEGVISYLSNLPVTKKNTARAISEEDLAKLNNLLKSNCENSLLYEIYYAVFHICLQTDMRISQILHLKKDCVKETLKRGQYVIVSSSKSSHGEAYEAGISSYTKKHIDDIIISTKQCRVECPEREMADYLFLYKSAIRNKYKTPRKGSFNEYLKECCEKLGIENYTAQHLRDTHMTKVEEYQLRKGINDMEAQLLTGHKRVDTTRNHYIMHTLENLLESTYGVVIGNVDINGQILYDLDEGSAKSKENTVSNKCGFCSKEACDLTSNLDCLMCQHFIATVDRIPYFKEQINRIDLLISNISSAHDKEDMINIKRLHLAYLYKLIEKKEKTHD